MTTWEDQWEDIRSKRSNPFGEEPGTNGNGRASLADRLRAKTLRGLDITKLPPLEWRMEGIIPSRSLFMLYGPPKAGKSFVSLDMTAHIATGRPWNDRHVKPCPQLYVVAEGFAGFAGRVRSWSEYVCGDGLESIHWFPGAINLSDQVQVYELAEYAREIEAKVVWFDTLARCTVGVEENSAKDMGLVVSNLDYIRDAIDGSVGVVHHSGKDSSKGARGSTALFGAVDAQIEVKGGDVVKVTLTDSKDAPSDFTMDFHKEQVLDSVVLVPKGAGTSGGQPKWADKALEVLRAIQIPGGVPAGQWSASCLEDEGIGQSSFYRARSWLVHVGRVVNVGTEARPKYLPSTVVGP